MSKDQAKGTAKELEGKGQEQAGELTGSKKRQPKGAGGQVVGKVRETSSEAKDAADDEEHIVRGIN
jgi:uncharacterized protein YjbJ (UPF0337 family)